MTDVALIVSAEAAEMLGIDRSTLTRWVERGELEAAQKLPGATGAYLFSPAVIERKLAEIRAKTSAADT